MESVDKATSTIPESMPQQSETNGNGDGAEQEIAVETESKEVPQAVQQQNWNDILSTGLSFLDKLGQTLLGQNNQLHEPISKVFSGLKIETDKTTGQRHLSLPIPKKEMLERAAKLLMELSKRV